ncbi:hypothetical protein Tco_1482595 [Tanacetum coccineum]
MLDKTNYSSWVSRMLLYIKGKPNGKFLVNSVLNGPFQYGTIVEPGTKTTPATVRARTYTDLTDEEKLRESVDIMATNIFLQGLPQYIYNLVNHNEDAKQIWDRVKLLIKSYYTRFTQLINDMHTIDIKLAKDMHTINFDHLYAHLRQHEAHENEVCLERQRYLNQIALVANSPSFLTNDLIANLNKLMALAIPQPLQQSSSTKLDSGLVVPSFNPNDDPIANLNKPMAFCTKLKRPENSTWFKEKLLLSEALESGAYLDPEQLAFLANNRYTFLPAQASQEIQTQAAFQTDDLDAFDSNCDDVPSAKAVLMANLSSYDSDVLSEGPFHDTNIEHARKTETSVVQSTSSSAQQDALLMFVIDEISSQVAKCNEVHQENNVVNETLTAKLERYKE